jgi:type VI secretion system ImpJ/VasE family protein
MSTQVHWHEGLFLQPHHLQALQRSVFTSLWGERRFAMAFPYGVIEMRLAKDDLADNRIRFDKLHIAMPSGAVFRFPQDAELPSLDIRDAFRDNPDGFTVGIGLPLWRHERANTIDHGEAKPGVRQKLIYQVHEREFPDENTGMNAQPLQLRRLNGMLMLENEDRSDMEWLPLVHVVRQVSDDAAGLPRPNPFFVPPTMLLSGTHVLFEMVRDLTSQICATREQLARQLANTPLDLRSLQGAQYEHLSRLRCLSRSAALLPSLLDDSPNVAGCAGRLPLFDIYLALKDLLSELTSLYPAKGILDALPYDHDNPYPPFADLDKKIRSFLGGITGPRYRKIEFHLEDGVFVGDLTPEFFKDITGLFLSIETPTDPATLVRLVEDRDHFKLMPASYGLRAIRGLTLKEERAAPLELPVKAKQYFYRVNTDDSGRIYEHFVREPQGICHFDVPDHTKFRLTLYATVPNPIG